MLQSLVEPSKQYIVSQEKVLVAERFNMVLVGLGPIFEFQHHLEGRITAVNIPICNRIYTNQETLRCSFDYGSFPAHICAQNCAQITCSSDTDCDCKFVDRAKRALPT